VYLSGIQITGRETLYVFSLLPRQKRGFPIKDFGHDKKYYKGALPPYKPPKEKSMKTKEKDQK